MSVYKRLSLVALLLSALGVTGCAYGALVCPKRGGDQWVEVTSENFVLHTNLSKGEAIKRSKELERMHHALAHVMNLDFPLEGTQTDPIEIIHFAHKEQLDKFTGTGIGGFMSKQDGLVTIAATEGSTKQSRDDTLLHELAHRFVAHQMSTYPTWLTEGLAGFFESLLVRDGRARVGLLPEEYRSMWFGNSSSAPSIRGLREMNREDFYDAKKRHANYFAAWRLVHFLSNSSPDMNQRFHAYAAALVRGASEAHAWDELFGAPEALEERVREYRGRRNVVTWNANYQTPKILEPEVRALSDGEVHILWARMSKLAFANTPKQDTLNERRLHEQLAEAKKHEPAWPGNTYWQLELAAEGSDDEQLATMRAHIKENPGDALALRRLIELELQHGSTTVDLLEPLVAHLAELAVYGRDFDLIAKFYTFARQPDKGIDFAVRAIERAPSCVSCYTTLALLRYQNQEFREALRLQERATELIGEIAEVPAGFLERLRFYERAVATANAQAAPRSLDDDAQALEGE